MAVRWGVGAVERQPGLDWWGALAFRRSQHLQNSIKSDNLATNDHSQGSFSWSTPEEDMSIVAVAVVGTRDGRPLYLRDFSDAANLLFSDPFGDDAADPFDDEFGPAVGTVTDAQRKEWPCGVGYQFALHAAHGRLGELVDGGGGGQWRPPQGSSGADCNWVGWLCDLDTTRAYGEQLHHGLEGTARISDLMLGC